MVGSERNRRKLHGVFYTPDPIALFMVCSTLRELTGESGVPNTLRILDPACGDGALLWPAYQFLCSRFETPAALSRLELIRRHLFGVDLDGAAIERLKKRFRDDLAQGLSSRALNAVLDQNFQCGNAVSGHGWERPDSARAFHWREQFPDVCESGGFDVIIANPPYRRERGAKSDLQELEGSPLATARRQARMDLWHYFFHRSLDLLRPGGLLTLIVNSYWTTSAAGRPLIERMAAESTPLEFVLLDTAPVFAGVGGRHLILRLRKGITDELCVIRRLREQQHKRVLEVVVWSRLSDAPRSVSATNTITEPFETQTLTREELFQNGRLNLETKPSQPFVVPPSGGLPTSEPSRTVHFLGEIFEVRQGIAENPPRVTRQQAAANLELHVGEGVFVLSTPELQGLKLSALERAVVRPYYSAVEIQKFWKPPAPHQWLLYLTRQTAPDLAALPNIERHLTRFRPILEQRRETRQGKIAWWHLHWPREPRLFEEPRILALQMAKEPRFAFVETPTYVGFSVNLIVNRPDHSRANLETGWSLEALAVILNSRWAADWFDIHAKRRGAKLDITGTTLKQFPLPEIDESTGTQLIQLRRSRVEIGVGHRSDVAREIQVIEHQIDELASEIIYGNRQPTTDN